MAFADPSSLKLPEFLALSDSSTDPSTLVSKFTSAVSKAVSSGAQESEVESLLWRAWNSVIATAGQTKPEQQDRLAQLLSELTKQPAVRDSNGHEVRVWDKKVWTDLPVFGAAVREAFNLDTLKGNDEKEQWININSFLAKLTSGSTEDGPLDFSLYGIWTLRDALEGEQGATVDDYKTQTAQAWLKYSGDHLESLSRKEKSFQGKLAAPGARYKEKSWNGFNKDRWQAWTQST